MTRTMPMRSMFDRVSRSLSPVGWLVIGAVLLLFAVPFVLAMGRAVMRSDLLHMNAEQRERYAAALERMVDGKSGPLSQHIRDAAAQAWADRFYSQDFAR